MEGFSKPDFWISMGVIFAVNAVIAGVLGSGVLAIADAATAFLALLTAGLLRRNAARR